MFDRKLLAPSVPIDLRQFRSVIIVILAFFEWNYTSYQKWTIVSKHFWAVAKLVIIGKIVDLMSKIF